MLIGLISTLLLGCKSPSSESSSIRNRPITIDEMINMFYNETYTYFCNTVIDGHDETIHNFKKDDLYLEIDYWDVDKEAWPYSYYDYYLPQSYIYTQTNGVFHKSTCDISLHDTINRYVPCLKYLEMVQNGEFDKWEYHKDNYSGQSKIVLDDSEYEVNMWITLENREYTVHNLHILLRNQETYTSIEYWSNWNTVGSENHAFVSMPKTEEDINNLLNDCDDFVQNLNSFQLCFNDSLNGDRKNDIKYAFQKTTNKRLVRANEIFNNEHVEYLEIDNNSSDMYHYHKNESGNFEKQKVDEIPEFFNYFLNYYQKAFYSYYEEITAIQNAFQTKYLLNDEYFNIHVYNPNSLEDNRIETTLSLTLEKGTPHPIFLTYLNEVYDDEGKPFSRLTNSYTFTLSYMSYNQTTVTLPNI